MLLVGYFEGTQSQRGIAWRCADSLSIRQFLGLKLTDHSPDHSSLTVIRERLPYTVHESVFEWVLRLANEKKLLGGKTVAVDSTTLEADAAMKRIVDLDSGMILGAEITPADSPDTQSLEDSLHQAQIYREAAGSETEIRDVAADKGYHATNTLNELAEHTNYRTYIPERKLSRGCRLRGTEKIQKRYFLMTAAYNLGVVMRMLLGVGTSRSMQGMMRAVFACFVALHTLSEALQTVYSAANHVIRHFRTQFRTWQFP